MVTPIYSMDVDEQLCFEAALDQWRRSLKRPDLSEEDRVKGALLAYMRQAFASRLFEQSGVEQMLTAGDDIGI